MFQKIINFVKYHNAFAIAMSLVLVLSFSAMASEDVRNAVIGEKIITEEGISNSQLLSADLDNFDLAMTITNVSENALDYYIDYQFKTLGVEGNVWQEISRRHQMTVSKEALFGKDLGLYVQKELSEIIDSELAFLKEAQNNEKKKGETQIVKTTEYTGLIGLVLDIKNKILPGYKPVVKPPEIIVASSELPLEPSGPQVETRSGIIVENTPPDTIIDTAPASETTSTEVVFEFHADQNNCTFQCKINSFEWTNCSSPKTYPGLTPGDYAFQVFATNELGRYDASPASSTWSVTEEVAPPVEEPAPPIEEATSTEETVPPKIISPPAEPEATSTPETATTTPE